VKVALNTKNQLINQSHKKR